MPKALVLQLDFHKSLQIPKVSSQDAYYKKRLTTRLFGIFDAGVKKLHAYIYPSTIGGQGPDEVISLIDILLKQLEHGFDHLVLWADNCPGQFKDCYLFFYCLWLTKSGRFLRVDLKFLLEGHTYSICDRRFGNIESAAKRLETIETPPNWISVLRQSAISNLEIHEVTLSMIKSYKVFLRNAYVSRSEDAEGNKVFVRRLAWLNFGLGEIRDDHGLLRLAKLGDGECFARYSIDPLEKPLRVNFMKRKQFTSLDNAALTFKNIQLIPVTREVKNNCLLLAKKYLSNDAIQYYEALPTSEEIESDEMDES